MGSDTNTSRALQAACINLKARRRTCWGSEERVNKNQASHSTRNRERTQTIIRHHKATFSSTLKKKPLRVLGTPQELKKTSPNPRG
jgi:hypothetical protein